MRRVRHPVLCNCVRRCREHVRAPDPLPQRLGQHLRPALEIRLLEHGGVDRGRVVELMVVDRVRERHQQRRPPGDGELRAGAGARPSNDEVRRLEPVGDIREERRQLRLDAKSPIRRTDPLEVLRPALLDQADPAPQRSGQKRERLRQRVRKRPGPLAAACDKQADRRVRLRRRVGTAGERRDLRADRVARMLVRRPRRQPPCIRHPKRELVRKPREQPVRPPKHRVLLVQDHVRPPPHQPRAEHRRHRRIAAESDDCGRRDPLQHAPRLRRPGRQRRRRLDPPAQPAPRDPRPRQHEAIAPLEHRRPLAATPRVRHQRDPVAAADQLGRKRLGREEMPASAPGRDHDRTDLLAPHRAISHRSERTRLRVSASSIPIPNAIASTEEPP